MIQYDNALCRQARSLPELLKQQYEDLEPKTRKVLTTPEIFSVQRIVLTGCGDSHAAAMAVKDTFVSLTGLPVEVVPAVELSRLYPKNRLGDAPLTPLVIAVSNSGGVARVGEAIHRCTSLGAFTLAVTGNRHSVLAKNSSRVLDLDIPPFESAPGCRTYLVSVLCLLLLAIRIGEVRGRFTMDEAMDMRSDLLLQGETLSRMLPNMDAQMCSLAQVWKDFPAYDFIGTGADFAAGWFGHAKVFEATGKYAMTVNTEEWLHLNFFIRNAEQTGTVLVANSESPAISRAVELAAYAKKLNRPLLILSDGTLFSDEYTVVQTPKTKYPFTKTLSQWVPLCLLMGYVGEQIGEKDGRGCEGNWAFCKDGACVKNSKLECIL